jgi:uncharacterized protein YdiU (UPF0061 family)
LVPQIDQVLLLIGIIVSLIQTHFSNEQGKSMFFEHPRYTQIGEHFAVPSEPVCFPNSHMVLWNSELATQLQWPLGDEETRALLSGHPITHPHKPLALAYSGHQFGHFNPTLGDGRAHLVGQVATPEGWYDIQTKGSGPSRFSRGGDGYCALGPALREFVMSEAMSRLHVPTTQCLAVLTTGRSVYRQTEEQGAICVRVASSHIRVGSFQYLALRDDTAGLTALMNLAISRHYPDISSSGTERVVDFVKAVCKRQAQLVLEWLRVGFIHGVMNTDNTLVNGETIDYGPCAMLEQYALDTVFSSIDKQGRYAFGNQAQMANWNCARLAESLIGLFATEEQGVECLSAALVEFATHFNRGYDQLWFTKLGLNADEPAHQQCVAEFKTILTEHKLDYTNTFAGLTLMALKGSTGAYDLPDPLKSWCDVWYAALDKASAAESMMRVNPAVIPRNHLVEQAIEKANAGDFEFTAKWLEILKHPYDYEAQIASEFISADPAGGKGYKTFCGT